ncbi:MAG: hypothetical protein Q4C00_06920, partial [Bacillota bacterium]|nr:hypothetical protein [Bacillota bacterium]
LKRPFLVLLYEVFDSDDYALAVDKMFLYMMQWLKAIGLKTANCSFTEYQTPLKTIISPTYAESYLSAVNIWHQAVYSDNEITESQRNEVKEILSVTQKTIWNNGSIFLKCKLKFHLFL